VTATSLSSINKRATACQGTKIRAKVMTLDEVEVIHL